MKITLNLSVRQIEKLTKLKESLGIRVTIKRLLEKMIEVILESLE